MLVDLNGAVSGHAVNGAAVEAILHSVSTPVQLGGGIRTLADIERWIEAGVSRVILGTVAVKEPKIVLDAARKWPEQIAVSVKHGRTLARLCPSLVRCRSNQRKAPARRPGRSENR